MKYLLLLLILSGLACSSAVHKPSSTLGHQHEAPPESALLLEQALKQSPETTVAALKSQTTAHGFDCLATARELNECLPASLLAQKNSSSSKKDRDTLLSHLRKFRPWKIDRKLSTGRTLMAEFQCSQSLEAQALGLSLERDFPESEAQTLSESLHEKVIACGGPEKNESLVRLTVFSIQKNQCPKALEFLKQVSPAPEQGVNDRVSYLHRICAPDLAIEKRNPWGGYGIRLSEFKITRPDSPKWFLKTSSGSEDWDRLLVSLLNLMEAGKKDRIVFLASKLNFENFRTLPHSFQASVLSVFHFAGADLSVFQTLHRYLAENPELSTQEVVSLLFPARYWKNILENSKGVDPVLVKSLIRQESAFNPSARSRAKAMGLMQVIYPTARAFGMKNKSKLMEIDPNIQVGSEILKKMIQSFGSVELALAAYNAGPEVVKDWQKRYPTENLDLFVEMIPYTETREYVRLVMRNYKIYQQVLLANESPSPVVQVQAQTQTKLPAPLDSENLGN